MKKICSIFLASLLAVNITACSSSNNKKENNSKPLKEINIGVMPSVDAFPYIVAKEKGIFEKNGIKVNIESFKSAKDRDAALQSGSLDGVCTDLVGVGLLKKSGLDLRITGSTDGKFQLVSSSQSGIKSVEDLKDKNIIISKNTVIEFTLDSILKKSNIKETEVVKEEVPQIPVRLEMLRNNKAQGALLPEPFSSLAMKDGGLLISDSEKLGIAPGVTAFTSKAIKEKTEELKKLYKSYNEAIEYIEKEPLASYEDILIKEIGFPKEMKGSITLPKFRKNTLPKEEDLKFAIEWLVDKNLASKDLKPSDLVDDFAVR